MIMFFLDPSLLLSASFNPNLSLRSAPVLLSALMMVFTLATIVLGLSWTHLV